MEKKKFNQLLSAGDIGTILENGGKDLSERQMSAVQRLAKEQSKEKLEQRQQQVASQPGYREFNTIPSMVESLKKAFSSQTITKAVGGNKTTNKVNEQNAASPSEEKGNKRDPKYSNIPTGRAERLKLDESEADILANIYNFMVKSHKRDVERMNKRQKLQKEVDEIKTKRDKGFQSFLDDRDRKEKVKRTKNKGLGIGSLLKGGLTAGLAIGGLLAMEKAFAKMAEIDFKDFIPSMGNIFGTKKEEEPASNAREAAEKYYGKTITDKEWELILKTVGAEADSDKIGIAKTTATILNRAKQGGDFGVGIEGVIRKPGQFQAASGTAKNPGESKLFKEGPSGKRLENIEESITNILPSVPEQQLFFTASNPKAYGPGTNPEFMKSPIFKKGEVVGGQIYNTPVTEAERDAAQMMKPKPVANAEPKLNRRTKELEYPKPPIDSTKENEVMREKRSSTNVGLMTETFALNNITVIEKEVIVEKKAPIDDTSWMLKIIRSQNALG
jgi:hypothetical protein